MECWMCWWHTQLLSCSLLCLLVHLSTRYWKRSRERHLWWAPSLITFIRSCFCCWFCRYVFFLYLSHFLYVRKTINNIFQSVFPVLFTFLPAFTAFILAMLQWKCDQLVSILGIFMGVAQMIDPLLVVYLITDYRKFVFGKFGTSTVHTITNSDSLRGHFH